MTDWRHRIKFDLWYIFGRPRWDTGIVPPEVVEFVGGHPPGRALDIGCGTGTNLLFLIKSGWQADGVDFSIQALKKADSRLKKAGVKSNLWLDDAAQLTKPQGEYNYILDIGCFHQLSEIQKNAYVAAVRRIMAPRSTLMIYGHCYVPWASRVHGLSNKNISALASEFTLLRREDGDEGQGRESVWLWLQRKGL